MELLTFGTFAGDAGPCSSRSISVLWSKDVEASKITIGFSGIASHTYLRANI